MKATLEMALEALTNPSVIAVQHAIELIRAKLAKPEQEPVCDKDPHLCGFVQCQLGKVCKNTPINKMPIKIVGPNLEQILNAAGFYKREWVGLTDGEIKHIMDCWRNGYIDIKKAEQLLKDKNT